MKRFIIYLGLFLTCIFLVRYLGFLTIGPALIGLACLLFPGELAGFFQTGALGMPFRKPLNQAVGQNRAMWIVRAFGICFLFIAWLAYQKVGIMPVKWP